MNEEETNTGFTRFYCFKSDDSCISNYFLDYETGNPDVLIRTACVNGNGCVFVYSFMEAFLG